VEQRPFWEERFLQSWSFSSFVQWWGFSLPTCSKGDPSVEAAVIPAALFWEAAVSPLEAAVSPLEAAVSLLEAATSVEAAEMEAAINL